MAGDNYSSPAWFDTIINELMRHELPENLFNRFIIGTGLQRMEWVNGWIDEGILKEIER